MQSWTIDDMLAYGPCHKYTRARLEHLWGNHERLTALDIARLDIPAADRIWALCQAGEHVAPAIERIVRRAVTTYALPCPETRTWAKRWLSGEDRTAASERKAERAAIAAWDAVCAAKAALNAAWAESALSAAKAARAAKAVERERQLADFVFVLESTARE